MNENVKDLIDLINWNNVSLNFALEFSLKFSKVVEKLGLQSQVKSKLKEILIRQRKISEKFESDSTLIKVSWAEFELIRGHKCSCWDIYVIIFADGSWYQLYVNTLGK